MWVNKSITKTVKNATDETTTQYINLIISELASEDGITAVSGENAVIIGNKLKLSFSSTDVTYAIITANIGSQSWKIGSIHVLNGTSGSRTYRIDFHIAGDMATNVINVKLKSFYTPADSLNFDTDMLYVKTKLNTELFAFTHISTASGSSTRNFATTQTLQRVSDQQAIYTVQKRIPYAHDSDTTKLDTITGKVLTSGNIRADIIDAMLDCSYITGDALYPSNGKQYYAVDNYTLIEV